MAHPTRRELLLASGVLFAWAHLPRAALAEGRDPRLLVIVLRGALDGLSAVPPVGDPDWLRLRGDKALSGDAVLPLDRFFALNLAMPNLHRLYRAGHATIVHAAATPYRRRSHFDGQDVLESGLPDVGASDSGWLNRALHGLQPEGRIGNKRAFAVGPVAPLVVRGPSPILSWVPPRLQPASDDTAARLLELYRHTDQGLAAALEERQEIAAIAEGAGMAAPKRVERAKGARAATRSYFATAAEGAARFMARPDGPRVGALAFDGWDTHANEGSANGRLALLLGALDGAIAAIQTGMGDAWNQTAVAIITEFGRTARINGTEGTDHGTATVALLVGGAVKGGRVIADWPGLADKNLHQGRDLKPTTDLRAVLKGLLRDHLRVDESALTKAVFPDSESVRPLDGLLAA